MRSLAIGLRKARLDRLIQQLLERHGEKGATETRILGAISRARAYGIRDLSDLEWFVDLDIERGENWEADPSLQLARDILESSETDVAGRRFRLEKLLRRWDANAR